MKAWPQPSITRCRRNSSRSRLRPSATRAGLLVLDGPHLEHREFAELPELLRGDDLLVLNETRVIPARVFGRYAGGNARVELLLLHPAGSLEYDPSARRWIALTKPARRLRTGTRVLFENFGEAIVTGELAEGMREIEFELRVPLEQFLAGSGEMPLPPYIPHAPRKRRSAIKASSLAFLEASRHRRHRCTLRRSCSNGSRRAASSSCD